MEPPNTTIRMTSSYRILKRDIEIQLNDQRTATQALERPFLMGILIKRIERLLDEQRAEEQATNQATQTLSRS